MLSANGLLAAVTILACGCFSGTAGELARPPEFDPGDQQTKCSITKSQQKPLIVEWPSAERTELEATAKSGVVVVRYDGCEMRLLSQCRAPGRYVYTAVTPKSDTVTIRDEDELYATIPIGAVRFEGKLARAGQLTVAMTMVGRFAAEQALVGRDQLEGVCDGATHILAGLTVGAFEFFAGADAAVGAGMGVLGAGAGTRSVAKRETLTRDGDLASCREPQDDGPPKGCGALLRVEVIALVEGGRSAAGGEAAPSSPPKAHAEATVLDEMTGAVIVEGPAAKALASARARLGRGDALGCLADLDDADELEPNSRLGSGSTYLRAQCEMQLGKCDEGMARLREMYSAQSPNISRATLDQMVDSIADLNCPSTQGSTETQVRRTASRVLMAQGRGDIRACDEHARVLERLVAELPATGAEKTRVLAGGGLQAAARCLGSAGRCAEARAFFKAGLAVSLSAAAVPAQLKTPEVIERLAAQQFAGVVASCKGE